jgi:hypothetical protein
MIIGKKMEGRLRTRIMLDAGPKKIYPTVETKQVSVQNRTNKFTEFLQKISREA